MADGGLLLTYRGYSTEDLMALQQQMRAQFLAMGAFSSQTIGGKSYTRDLRFLQSQMEAIQFVLNERTTPYQGTIITDFSQDGILRGEPAGTIDQFTGPAPGAVTASPPSPGAGSQTVTTGDLPTGGTAGQLLQKQSSADFDADWATVSGSTLTDTNAPSAPGGVTVTPTP